MLNPIDSRYEIEAVKWNGFLIKRMGTGDLEEVVSISSSSRFAPWSSEMFLGEMNHSFSHCFLIGSDQPPEGQALGFICFRTIQDESELLNLGVHPRFRKMGLGRSLMQFYIHFCTQMKVRRFYLEVSPSNEEALRLYRSLHYGPFGRRERFYGGKEDALLLVRET